MTEEQEQVWDSLKHGIPASCRTRIHFIADGTATKFHSAWFNGTRLFRVTVDDVAQSQYRDFRLVGSEIVFKHPPAAYLQVMVEVYNGISKRLF